MTSESPEVFIVTITNVVCDECGTVADDVTAEDAHDLRERHIAGHAVPRMPTSVSARPFRLAEEA